ncbi:MAG: hypothetical protein AB1Z98_18135 [Nannocystaceae bacterium]
MNPELRTLVEAARAQPTPTVGVDADAIHAGWAQRRGRRRTLVIGGLAAAALLALAIGVVAPSEPADRPQDQPPAGAMAGLGPDTVETPRPSITKTGPVATDPISPTTASPPSKPPLPRLAVEVSVSALGEHHDPASAPEVLDSHRLRVTSGGWSIDSRAPEPVTVELPAGSLQLRGGHVHVQVAADRAHGQQVEVEVLRGEVLRFDADGTLVPEPGASPTPPTGPSADALAREVEDHLMAGRRGEAIGTLQRLVTLHPRSAAARAGLIDLGRLLEEAGQVDRARCAYAAFLKRWPGHALSGDVAKAQRALGEGPGCRGLRPRG